MDFEEYFRKNFNDGLSEPSKHILRFTFEAGQQSKQAEIDALKAEIISIINSITLYEYDLDTMGKINKIKELLK